MGVPTWRRLGRGWVWMFTRRRSSRRLPIRSQVSWRCSGWAGRPSRWRNSAPGCRRRSGSPMRRAPTGFGLARALAARGIDCTVAAPGKIERPAQDRVKTDRRDAERLARLLMIGGLHPVRVPTPAEEAMRD